MKLYGDYHTHTEYSRDGTASIDAMVKTAKEKGLQEIAITDHGPKSFNGCKTKHYPHVRALIEKARAEHDMTVYVGVESNVMNAEGQIDVPEDFRKDIDILLCGFHPGVWKSVSIKSMFNFWLPNYMCLMMRWFPKRRVRKNTVAMINAIEQNDIDVWVHPNRYFKLDVVEVAKTCVERGTLIELNGKKKGLAIRPIDYERMAAIGAKFIISSDAHRTQDVGQWDRVSEFLKNCDWKSEDIINLNGPFKREVNVLKKVIEEELTQKEHVEEIKLSKAEKKEKKKREKIIKKKAEE